VADGWCWFVLREKYCWLVVDAWFVLREKYCWLVADKPSKRAAELRILPAAMLPNHWTARLVACPPNGSHSEPDHASFCALGPMPPPG
jgi:hypothetical protein